MSEDDAPKSAYELAMERLKARDREEGVEEHPLTDDQREQIGLMMTGQHDPREHCPPSRSSADAETGG